MPNRSRTIINMKALRTVNNKDLVNVLTSSRKRSSQRFVVLIPLKGVKVAENIANQNANIINLRVKVARTEKPKNQKGWFQIIY